MKAWLKGGLWGLGIGIFIFLITYLPNGEWKSLGFVILSLPAFAVALPFIFVFDLFLTKILGVIPNDDVLIWYYGLFGWIILGIFIGWIVEKVRARKK